MKDYREEDRRVRERLERQSSGGRRADVAGSLNKLISNQAARELPGLDAYGTILQRAAVGRVKAGGSMSADARTRREKFSSGEVSPVEPEWLTTEAMRTIAAARVRSSRYF